MKNDYIKTRDFPSVQAARRASEHDLSYYRSMRAQKPCPDIEVDKREKSLYNSNLKLSK
jgi:hypothetical protein